ncbi:MULTISPECIES: hypothetical protein [Stenotrophomonas]|uniref:hypothetical protein n=1 Tax=Stenotrophomonas TaxID=40323 RepID=UPI000770598F|nr:MULTISPECIES: hypothetical protein [Stenotrophomonas]AMJ56650.1 hypothetical protein AXG53_08375 [Stenotrophomonas sp. KCTC 12332]
MNRNTRETALIRAKAVGRSLRDRVGAAVALGGAAAAPGLAFAADGFDSATVLAAIAAMVAAGVLIYTAYAVGKWTMKAFGLIGGK